MTSYQSGSLHPIRLRETRNSDYEEGNGRNGEEVDFSARLEYSAFHQRVSHQQDNGKGKQTPPVGRNVSHLGRERSLHVILGRRKCWIGSRAIRLIVCSGFFSALPWQDPAEPRRVCHLSGHVRRQECYFFREWIPKIAGKKTSGAGTGQPN